MLTLEELAGIVEVMVVASEEELLEIAMELAYMTDDEPPEMDELAELIKSALKIKWLESIPQPALCTEIAGSRFFIAGPASFGTVPPEMSEIMEVIEFEGCRAFDWEIVTSNIIPAVSRKVERLELLVEEVADSMADLEDAEEQYSELFNLYYDYDFWLPDGLPGIGEQLEKISSRLTELKE